MGKQTAIAWTQKTWNPWQGCRKVSQGCKYCYMFRDKERYGQDPGTVVVSSSKTFFNPLHWHEPALVFTCSWSDWFISEADAWRPTAWEVIKNTPHLTYQILTKRPERILSNLPADWGEGYKNVWIGVSVEDQEAAKIRIPLLQHIPAAIRFISFEPLLGPIHLDRLGIDRLPFEWAIIGGESGSRTGKYRYRPCDVRWIQSLLKQCQGAGVPCFVKQLGSHLAHGAKFSDGHGKDPQEWPEHLRVQHYPYSFALDQIPATTEEQKRRKAIAQKIIKTAHSFLNL